MAGKYEVLPNFRFVLRVEAAFDVPLKSIRPFTKENEFEQIEEGGLNDYVHIKRKHCTRPHTIQVERYLTEDFYDPIPNGTSFALPLLLFVGGNNGQEFSWAPRRTYCFFGAQVMNKEIGGFDAEKSGLLTETVTIAYHQLYMMDTPVDLEDETWSIKSSTGTGANIENLYAYKDVTVPAQNKTEKKEFVARAKENTWHFGEDADDYLGSGKRYSGSPELKIKKNTRTRKDLETAAKANTWHFAKDPKNYLGNGITHSRSEVVEDPKARPYYNESSGKSSVGTTKLELSMKKAERNTWHFGPSKEDFLGNKKIHANKLPEAEGQRTDIDEKSLAIKKAEENTWRFADNSKNYTGNGKMHAKHINGEKSVTELEAAAAEKRWPNASYALKLPKTPTESQE